MIKVKDVGKSMVGTPRPHYLRGEATIREVEKGYTLDSKVLFPADEGHPSVLDRGPGKYLEGAHVNLGDFLFSVWNGVHLLASEVGSNSRRILRKEYGGKFGSKPVLPDTEYDLHVELQIDRELRDGQLLGVVSGELRDSEGDVIISHWAHYLAEK